MVILFILGILLFTISIGTFFVSEYGISVCTAYMAGFFLSTSLHILFTYEEPTAMDVYKGKTTLEITYRDSVAIDSVVVFKKK